MVSDERILQHPVKHIIGRTITGVLSGATVGGGGDVAIQGGLKEVTPTLLIPLVLEGVIVAGIIGTAVGIGDVVGARRRRAGQAS